MIIDQIVKYATVREKVVVEICKKQWLMQLVL